ncbi:uncharacterized protein B0P05DRAFT_140928 [Gilbertella persicaria]|uniref:uncharacterized protein n=1 Tax=Gilbertella persicaria TaxID=101096 RepID=UPI00221F5992|nr:uncharacterized protein B0P05DRAFT_140928 [Gilbertella persicaria]KAI8076489.1 hypothetical protein B0P05DRAFT_140928 [Gilbertella persicaria]
MPFIISETNWRNKCFDFHQWCKIISIGLNVIYMIQTFEYIYEAGSHMDDHTVSLQFGFQIVVGCLMLVCLIADLVVLNTSKLAVADWYWRPDVVFQNCQQRLVNATRSQVISLISEICSMQNQLNHLYSIGIMLRDILTCGAYATASYFYMIHLIQVLKRTVGTADTALHVMTNSYQYPITQ